MNLSSDPQVEALEAMECAESAPGAASAFSSGKVDLAVVRGDVGDLSQAQARRCGARELRWRSEGLPALPGRCWPPGETVTMEKK
jgi:hypothetical protein